MAHSARSSSSGARERDVLARGRARQLDHRRRAPRRARVDRRCPGTSTSSVPRTSSAARRDHALGEVHHAVDVAERLVRLEHRELGVVADRDALVAEGAVDLVDALEPADEQPLEVQLRRDAQVERPCRARCGASRTAARSRRRGSGAASASRPRGSRAPPCSAGWPR